jgi:hypothetical protein
MKKWLLIVAGILGLLLASAYIFFPKELDSSNIEKFNCSINIVDRFVAAEDKWPKWWPGTVRHDSISNKNIFAYNGYEYVITGIKYNAILIQARALDLNVDGTIFFLPVRMDSVQAEWKYSLATNSNPINRIYLYLETKKINNNLLVILKSMKAFLEKQENVYGMNIEQEIVKDTILVTTNFSSAQYPSTSKIYEAIDGIKNYIALNNAKETNSPMLHVRQDSGLYKTQVAIPVNITIPENQMYLIKRMVPGKILVGQVTGGAYTALEALRQMGLFLSDNNMSSPAIPFESLITNRLQEPDTSKWITRIYYPVF